MSELETTIYVVGAKRRWAIRGRVLQHSIVLVLLVLLGLVAGIAFLRYSHEKQTVLLQDQLEQEVLKSSKLQALLVERTTREALPEEQTAEERRLTEQQAELIERQKRQLQELRDALRQRELVVQQLEVEKRSAQTQIEELQEQLRETELAMRQVEAEVEELRDQNMEATTPLPNPEADTSDRILLVEGLQMKVSGGQLSLKFNLTNNTGEIQQGRVGVMLLPKDALESPVEFSPAKTIPFRIRRFRVISRDYPFKDPNLFVRIVAWNSSREKVMDENFPVPSN
jgi:hypothetical protein